jgi:hypothetical protein
VPVPKFLQERGETFERNNDITRDGTQFLGVVAAGSAAASGAAAAPQIQVVLNWFEELKARADEVARASGLGSGTAHYSREVAKWLPTRQHGWETRSALRRTFLRPQ